MSHSNFVTNAISQQNRHYSYTTETSTECIKRSIAIQCIVKGLQ